MRRAGLSFDTVRKIGLTLAGVEESTMYGAPALKVRGKLLACIPTHKSAEPDSVAVRIDFDRRAELLETDPETYYVKDHYVGYSIVLVRMARIHPDALRDLLGMSYKFVARDSGGKSDPRVRRAVRARSFSRKGKGKNA